MTISRIRLGHADGEVAPNTWSDFDWVHDHEKELLAQYGESIILVYQQQVIGVGHTIDEVLANAEQNLDPSVREVTPITCFLHQRQPFFRVRPSRI